MPHKDTHGSIIHVTEKRGNLLSPSPLTSIPAWISNHMPSRVVDQVTYPFPNFNGVTVEVWEWISNFIPHLMMDVIIHPCWVKRKQFTRYVWFVRKYTPCNPLAHLWQNTTLTWYFRGNIHLHWFNRFVCTGEHFQSDLDVSRFDTMFVKLRDLPPIFYHTHTHCFEGVRLMFMNRPCAIHVW